MTAICLNTFLSLPVYIICIHYRFIMHIPPGIYVVNYYR